MKKFANNKSSPFYPKSIAIVGAAREPEKLGNIIVTNIQQGGFAGKIYPVNPNAAEINNLPCYPSYHDIPAAPELAIMAVPADVALNLIPEIADQGTRNILILGAGFKEIGPEGASREARLVSLAQKYRLTVIGPNCLGFVNNNISLNATFGQANHTAGNGRFISQSGAIATAMFDWAHSTGVGFSEFITIGNKAILGENEILEFWLNRRAPKEKKEDFDRSGLSQYRPVGLYLESISDGPKFVKLARQIGQTDPLFVLMPGKSDEAKQASKSHTGSLAGNDAVLSAALKSCGAIRCQGVEDFFDLARGFAWENAPRGPGVAVVSNAGGPAVIVADAIKAEGLELSKLSNKARKILASSLPSAAALNNPIDVLGDALADRYRKAIEAVLSEKSVDALIVVLTPQIMTQIESTAEAIGALSKKYHKPILCSFMGGYAIKQGETVLNRYRIPSFRFPERAVKTLGEMYKWEKWRSESRNQKSKKTRKQEDNKSKKQEINKTKKSERVLDDILIKSKSEGQKALSVLDAQILIESAGIKYPFTRQIKNFAEALAAARSAQYPAVLKISAPALLHKTEAGGVITNIKNEIELKKSFEYLAKKIQQHKLAGAKIILQKQIRSGVEVIVGCRRDPNFGPVMLFGAGGRLSELIADKNLSLFPVDIDSALELIKGSKIYPLLAGWRGAKPLAIRHLAKLMVTLGSLFLDCSQIAELEINPVIVTESGASAADARVILF